MRLSSQSPSPWLHISRPNPQARLRLFCFPYAGGGASLYRLWHQHLPEFVEVCAVQLPGRENRIQEERFTDIDALTRTLIPNLSSYLDKPFALFGHSMGALLAYETAQRLHRQQGPLPSHLFVSGRRAPFLPGSEAKLHTIPSDTEFLAALQRRYENLPDIIFQDAELRALFLPLLRADFQMTETYQSDSPKPLPCPLVAFGGDRDRLASRSELLAWQEMTDRDFALHLLPGGHFYLNQETVPLLRLLAGFLH